jgi:hypothetical protein
MSGHVKSLATKGIICKPGETFVTQFIKYILPLNLKLTSDTIKLNLKSPETIKLNLKLCED